MNEYKGLRKLLIGTMAFMLMATVVVVSVKFGGKNPPLKPDQMIQKPNTDGGMSPLPPSQQKEATYEEALASINEADLKKDLYYLAGTELEGRMSGKKGNLVAARFIEDSYKSYGLPTMLHQFPMSRFNPGPKNEEGDPFSSNIYAWIEGNDPVLKNEIVVVGAHMDHIGYGPKGSMAPGRTGQVHPGADDNGSGTVALLKIARAFSMMKGKVKRTVVFMSFSGEEMGLIGSQYYCNNPVFPKGSPSMSKHVAMINMDMIGRLKESSHEAFVYGKSSDELDRACNDLLQKYPFGSSVTKRGAGGSDHAPFYNKRVPVVCLHTGMHKEYHTPDDSPNRINYRGLEKVARYAFELVWSVANAKSRPAFNHTRFVPMDEGSDHGRKKF